MLAALLIVLAQVGQIGQVEWQGRYYTDSEMTFRTVDGGLQAYHPNHGWAPAIQNPTMFRGQARLATSSDGLRKTWNVDTSGRLRSANSQKGQPVYYTSGPEDDDDAPQPPIVAKRQAVSSGPGSHTGTVGGKGTGGNAAQSVAAKTTASPAKVVTTQDKIKKLVATPKPPNTANGGKERYEFTMSRLDAGEIQMAELKSEVTSLKDVTKTLGEALEGLVKILEKK